MPSFQFLFETRKIVGEPSPKAIQGLLPASSQPPAGYEIVPTVRAERLVSYLLSLKDSYAYPEAANVYVAKSESQGGAAAEGAKK